MSKKVKAEPKIPYADTKISPDKTKAEISEMLKLHGIENIQWTAFRGEEVLRFLKEVELKGVRRELMFEVKPPMIMAKKRTYDVKESKYILINVPLWAQAWRLVYWYLEAKLKAVEWGLVSLEREMMAQITVPLPDGSALTLGDVIERRIAEDTLAKLPSPDDEGRRVVEAEFVERKEAEG
jgi:hypothetical protein